ncbi:flavin-containing monooxygenase [Hymenobacter metallilatus]|uniref:FAD-dependent oxidoreductase n=1 Tax=Hymenobacter metallilatus TaxID=2493666 RepID=A0A428JTD7_9BACT|nr:NAD(P)/FAD-dependent oxidoreductase [Hymenobacter metallilatus]RSK37281.1 FAD-dependent oxidoreductase [Hymenobacter metallilatus]
MIPNGVPASTPRTTDTLVIGAGQAGLAAAYYLQQHGTACLLLDERPAVGHLWATRYDSLRLFSPAWASRLPGLPWPGRALRYPTAQEAAAYLQDYARHFGFAIEHNQRVQLVQPTAGGYHTHTASGQQYLSRRIIVCTGPYTTPTIPAFAADLEPGVQQMHSSHYQRPQQVAGTGPVAVVGSGNSALQIAADLAATGRPVFVAFDEKTPATPNNTAMWLLLLGTGILEASRTSWLGRFMRSQPEPVVRQDLQRLRKLANVQFIGRALATSGPDSLRGKLATTAPLEAVLWATGYAPAYSWLQVPGALTASGEPVQQQGMSLAPGLAFLGLPWQRNRRSALMGGAAADARHVVRCLLKST